jgi:hypothetical protein
MHGAPDDALQQTVEADVGAAVMHAVRSAEWIKTLQKIIYVPHNVQGALTLTLRFLAVAGAPQQMLQTHTNTLQTIPAAF